MSFLEQDQVEPVKSLREQLKDALAPTPWAIEPMLGIFDCTVAMGESEQEAFNYACQCFRGDSKKKNS